MLRSFILSVLLAGVAASSHAQDTTFSRGRTCNIISVMPFQFTENGLGFGGCYERLLDRKGVFSFELPALVTFNLANTNRIYDYSTGNYSTGKPNAVFYAMPGIKFYPAGSRGKLKYAVGVSVVGGAGKESVGYVNLYGLNTTERVVSYSLLGAMLQNSLNMRAGKNVYVGLEMGIGTTFADRVDNNGKGNLTLVQGCFKIGYCF